MKATQLTTESEAGLIRRNTNRAAQALDKPNKSPSFLNLDTSREQTHLLATQNLWLKKEKLPNATLELIDKAGHYVHMDKPKQLVQIVTNFLELV